MPDLGLPVGAERHHGNHADVVQRQVQRHELRTVRELNNRAIQWLQPKAQEPRRETFRRSNQILIGDPILAMDDGDLLRQTARCALDHLGHRDAFPQAGLDVPACEPPPATVHNPSASVSSGEASGRYYSGAPMVSAIVPTPAIEPAM